MSAFDSIKKEVSEARANALWTKGASGASLAAATELRKIWEATKKALDPSRQDIPLTCARQVPTEGRLPVTEHVFKASTADGVTFGIDIALEIGDITEKLTLGIFGKPSGAAYEWYLTINGELLKTKPYWVGPEPSPINADKVAVEVINSLKSSLIKKASS